MTWHLSISLDILPPPFTLTLYVLEMPAASFVVCITSPYCFVYPCISCTFLSLKEFSPFLTKLFSVFYFSISTQMSLFSFEVFPTLLYAFSVTLYLNYTFIIAHIIFYCASSLYMCPTLKCQYFERVCN